VVELVVESDTVRRASLPTNVRTIGMIGGLGPESTIDYYRSIIARYRARQPGGGYPHLIINSLDVDKGIAMLDAGRLDELTNYLAAGLEMLARAGADLGFIAANTPHLVFDEVQHRSAIPLLSIVRATSDHARALGLKKVGLFGTGFTMRASFYPNELQRAGIALVLPKESEREFIHRKYIGELLKNQFLPETKDGNSAYSAPDESRRRHRGVNPGGNRTPTAIARIRRHRHRVSRHDRDSCRSCG
jgi:aspartate racemase